MQSNRQPQTADPSAKDDALPFRSAPHNLEAEQALLGAILVNNEALDRVSGFLGPEHFFDPLHAEIYETAAKLIQMGKQATPITLRTFFEKAEPIDAGLTVPQYLGRLAANALVIRNKLLAKAKFKNARCDQDRRIQGSLGVQAGLGRRRKRNQRRRRLAQGPQRRHPQAWVKQNPAPMRRAVRINKSAPARDLAAGIVEHKLGFADLREQRVAGAS